MLDSQIIDHLRQNGMLREGHFSFRSGRHSTGLLDRDLLLADPAVASRFGYAIAKHFFTDHIETIAAPSIWGAGLAQWVGYFLDPRAKVVDATPGPNGLSIAEKLTPLVAGRRVLLVDNLVISGETLVHFDKLLTDLGATVVGVGTLWSSGGLTVADHPVYAVLNEFYTAYSADECIACRAGDDAIESIGY